VQLAWLVCDENHVVLKKESHIIRPKYFEIPEESTKIHGIDQITAKTTGKKIEFVLHEFLKDIDRCDRVIAHNINFDYHVLLAELYRVGMVSLKYLNIPQYCTMLSASKPNEKWYKLVDLYEKYYGNKPSIPLHRADNDIELCHAVYMYQQKL
jgi:DNA polymerase III epsilon subunit-like protein